MSCDLIFDGNRGGLVVASAGTWSAVSEKDGTISITYPYAKQIYGVSSTIINLPMETFLNYKKFCEEKSIDANMTEENLPDIIKNHSRRPSGAKHAHDYDVLNPK